METPKTSENGLKVLTVCGENHRKHLNSCIMTSNLMSPPSSPSFSHIGDYIGTESCVDLKNGDGEEDVNMTTARSDDDDEDSTGFRSRQRYQCRRDRRWAMKKRDFPPPISLLSRTENQPSLTPFVLKRYYTSDGRLILREERVRHHEYFKVHRSNGHLTLQLIHIHQDDIWAPPMADHLDYQHDEQSQCNAAEEEEEEVPEAELETGDSGEKNEFVDEIDIVDKEVEQEPVEKYNAFESSSSAENESVGIGGGNGGGGGGAAANKCLNYSNVIMSSSCFLGLPVPAAKPVHT